MFVYSDSAAEGCGNLDFAEMDFDEISGRFLIPNISVARESMRALLTFLSSPEKYNSKDLQSEKAKKVLLEALQGKGHNRVVGAESRGTGKAKKPADTQYESQHSPIAAQLSSLAAGALLTLVRNGVLSAGIALEQLQPILSDCRSDIVYPYAELAMSLAQSARTAAAAAAHPLSTLMVMLPRATPDILRVVSSVLRRG